MATQQEKSSNNLSNKPISNIMSPTSDPEEPSKKQNAVMEWLLGKLKVFVTSAFRMNSSVSLCSINFKNVKWRPTVWKFKILIDTQVYVKSILAKFESQQLLFFYNFRDSEL